MRPSTFALWPFRKLRSLLIALRRRAVILLYHRVTELPEDPQWLCVPPALFEEHLDVLCSHYHLLSLSALTRHLSAGNLPPRSVVVTFDDGYADNLHEAKPRLERRAVPATVFIAAGQPERPTEFWWDELEGLLLGTSDVAGALEVTVNGRPYRLPIDEGGCTNAASPSAGVARWNVTVSGCPTPRHRAYRELAPLLREMDEAGREAVLATLARRAGVSRGVRSSHRTMQPDEIVKLASGGLVEIGAHTLSHPVLSRLSPDVQRQEIEGSRRRLEEVLGRPVTSFAYPFGTRSDYTAETVAAVRAAGFERACSNFPGTATGSTDPFQLPRFLVRDWDGDEFGRHLATFFRS